QGDRAVVVQGHHPHRAGVTDHLALMTAAIRRLDVHDGHLEAPPGPFPAFGGDAAGAADVRPAHGTDRTISGSSTGNSCGRRPSARSSAAATNSRNSGAGRLGRLLNSGCACVPTQNGWSDSSTNSTSRPSGEVPEHTNPEPSNLPR